MDETLTNTIIALVAVVGSIGSMVAFLVARIELRGQRQETRELQKTASELEHKVHRLATHLDHRIYRLERVRDLINNVMGVSVQLRQGNRQHIEKLNAAVTRDMAMPELDAIIKTIGDKQLGDLFVDLAEIYGHPVWEKMWNKAFSSDEFAEADLLLQKQSTCTKAMHKRVLELWEEVTSDEEYQ